VSREIQTAAAEADAKLEEAHTMCNLAHMRKLQAEQALSSGVWEVNDHARNGQAVATRLRSHGGKLMRKRGGNGGCALRVAGTGGRRAAREKRWDWRMRGRRNSKRWDKWWDKSVRGRRDLWMKMRERRGSGG